MKNIWDKNKVEQALQECNKIRQEKGGLPFPRQFLYLCGWDVENYQEYLIRYKLNALTIDKNEIFAMIKDQIDNILSYVQQLMLKGSISPAAYETTIKEFETNGISIKEQASHTKDRYEKLKRQQEEQVNNSGIKLC